MRVSFVCLAVGLEATAAFSPTTPSRRPSYSTHQRAFSNSPWSLSAATSTSATELARLSPDHLQELADKKYLVIPNFVPARLEEDLRTDVSQLRAKGKFSVAKIGQDATNTLNTQIRVAETCFIGPGRYPDVPSSAREDLYTVLDQARQDLARYFEQPLDSQLTELLYAYYPQGGFYRRHRDAIPGSASVLREYSLLLYLNKEWQEKDGGKLRMHFDGGGDAVPEGGEPNFMDVSPQGGTLVLFESDAVPHEVLDTQKERMAVIGWYNRPMALSDVADISGGEGGNPMQIAMLGVAAALVTIGLAQILS
mmetsp:Transcript_6221/g.12444  ORF Transcript_6221/g.12444 Transcript_6221/m.12444 type:complete len:309 (-) Transcript_6221:207-1133(-)